MRLSPPVAPSPLDLLPSSPEPGQPIAVSDQPAPGALLPSFPGGSLPAPEPALVTFSIRAVAVLTLVASLAYLLWRVLFTVNPEVWWIAVPFLLLEVHAVISYGLFTFSLWDLHAQQPARPVTATDERIAVLIPTYNESREILLPTIAAAVALQPAHETWVLDDGERAWVAELAADLGARYLTRPERSHAKAGNINHALRHIEADIIAVLDADHVATPGFLRQTLGYFADPRLALVQTPQDFYNLDSFEHETVSAQDRTEQQERYHEQALFYRAIQPGKNRWGAAFCCGTGAIFRVAALREIGGFATETITEDIHTTLRLHRRGWKTVYHNEVLARGLAASTADQYQLQRFRWGTGAMQLLRLENPLTVSGLRLPQRLAYAATLLGWFDAWRSLGYLLVPPLVLLTGAIPIQADPVTFLVWFGLTFLLQRIALRLLSRNYGRVILPTIFELVRMTPNLLATLTLFRRRPARFQVTPKGRLGSQRRRVQTPRLLIAIAIVNAYAALWFALTLAGVTPLRYEVPWAAYGAAFWLVVNYALIVLTVARIRTMRFGAERRSSVRFATALTGTLDARPCTIEDVSLTGALIALPPTAAEHQPLDAETHDLRIELGQTRIHLRALIRSRRRADDGRVRYGLEFLTNQPRTQAALALALFNAQIVPDVVPATLATAAPAA